MNGPTGVGGAVALAHRQHWSRLLALLAGSLRSLDVAEEALADAFAAALTAWERDGVPTNAPAWLLTVARRRATDRLRREATLVRKLPLLVTDETEPGPGVPADDAVIPDERLRLIFTCAHPALAAESRIALTLRYVAGLSTTEVARGFLVSEATMAARLTRAKKKIAAAAIPYRVPDAAELPERLDGVLAVLYLIFTEGYAASSGPGPLRRDLADEAIRLTRLLRTLLPGEPEISGLLALMLLHHSRRDSRTDGAGAIVLLADQDRTRWHYGEIYEARTLLGRARGPAGNYRLQAMIAAEHARAPTAADTDTDWHAIAGLYALLEACTGSPVVRLNRAIAVAECAGPRAGLDLLAALDEPLARHHLFFATRADLAHRAGDDVAAVVDLDRALALARTDADRLLLLRRRATWVG